MMPIPAIEVDRRISASLGRLESTISKLGQDMAQVIGSTELPGVLFRLEKQSDENQKSLRILLDRRLDDDHFRKEAFNRLDRIDADVQTLDAEVQTLKTIIRIAKMVSSVVHGAGEAAAGKAPKTLWAILGVSGWVAIVQFWHTGWPIVRESLIHHKLMH
jgi:hypothetical protein